MDRPYPLSRAMQQVVNDDLDRILRLGVIEESNSPWSISTRKLNAFTFINAYPLPCIEGILPRIDQTFYISSVDLKFAYWQVEIDEKTLHSIDRPRKTIVPVTVGLCNASQRLVQLMEKVIPAELRIIIFVYDLLIDECLKSVSSGGKYFQRLT